MRTSYGVVWREGSGPLAHGKLELLARAVRLDGMAGSVPVTHELAYDELAEIRVGRSAADRVDGRPSLVLERRDGEVVRIASVAQSGVIAEIAERLAELQLGTEGRRRIAIVLPLREGSEEAVRSLVVGGPPFDPRRSRLDRHDVFLTSREAVFLFESRLGVEALEQLLSEPDLWESAAAWREHLAGPPLIAEPVYAWSRGEATVDGSLVPPGLRDDG